MPKLAAPKKSQNRASDAFNKKPPQNQIKANKEEEFTPFKISVDHVFNAIKDQS